MKAAEADGGVASLGFCFSQSLRSARRHWQSNAGSPKAERAVWLGKGVSRRNLNAFNCFWRKDSAVDRALLLPRFPCALLTNSGAFVSHCTLPALCAVFWDLPLGSRQHRLEPSYFHSGSKQQARAVPSQGLQLQAAVCAFCHSGVIGFYEKPFDDWQMKSARQCFRLIKSLFICYMIGWKLFICYVIGWKRQWKSVRCFQFCIAAVGKSS